MDKDKTESALAGCAAFVIIMLVTIPLLVVTSILNGLVLCSLWTWFIIPTFHLPLLSLPMAIGMCLIVGYLTKPHIPKDKNMEEDYKAGLINVFLYPLFTWGIGWVIHLFCAN